MTQSGDFAQAQSLILRPEIIGISMRISFGLFCKMSCILAPTCVVLNTSRDWIFPQLKLGKSEIILLFYFCSVRKCHRCKRFKSVWTGSFFEATKLPLQQHVQFLWKWSQSGSLTLMSSEGIASKKTLVKMSRHCLEVAWRALILHPIPMLGGRGVIVQIDESKFNHKSKVCSDIFLYHCVRKDILSVW